MTVSFSCAVLALGSCGDQDGAMGVEASGNNGNMEKSSSLSPHPVFIKTDEELLEEYPDKWVSIFPSDRARAVELRFSEGRRAFQGLDAEVLPFVEYLETSQWLSSFDRDTDTIWGPTWAGMTAVFAIGYAAYAPDSSLSDGMRQRCLDAIEAIGELESSFVRAACISSTRALLGERPDFVVTDEYYAGLIDRWSKTPTAAEEAEKMLFETMPERFGEIDGDGG